MPKFVVERPLPNIGDASYEEQQSMLKVSGEIIARLGEGRIRWLESVVYAYPGSVVYDTITEVRYTLRAPPSTKDGAARDAD